jgi:hypothetical protein
MKRMLLVAVLGCAMIGAAGKAQAVNFGVNPPSGWNGFMNVFFSPADGGGYAFGSGWGIADLTAVVSGPTLTLGPNTISDTSSYWYQGAGPNPGGPGAPGNKTMDANFYVEPLTGTLAGQSVTFSGTVLSNSLVAPYTSVAFIKDFAPDYSSNVPVTVALTPGPFSITLNAINDPNRHVQYGFETIGPNVWATDVGPKGKVVIAVVPEPATACLAAVGLAAIAGGAWGGKWE